MHGMLPEVKEYQKSEGNTIGFNRLELNALSVRDILDDAEELLLLKLWNYKDISIGKGGYKIELISQSELPKDQVVKDLFKKQGYILRIEKGKCQIGFTSREGLVNAFSTMKQLFQKNNNGLYHMACGFISDWPSIECRSVSNTFAWYAGYGRFGFDMQLWGYEEWVEYLNICSDFKINQFNLCMYGYWPFEFDKYPDTILRGHKMKVWNPESKNWVTIEYMHPNLAEEFLTRLIEHGHKLCFKFFAYIGLNSYNGGYPSIHKDKRMKLPSGCKSINDFDRMCLSDEDCISYLKDSVIRIIQLGFDGFDFEESEEATWYCDCAKCTENYQGIPEEAMHIANFKLFTELYTIIKKENPACIIGVRAWRQKPLEKPTEVLEKMLKSIPNDVVLFWAPGLYVQESEFEKWVNAFGKHRIMARDTESNAISSCFGRLIRIFRSNGLRCHEETNDQFLEEDIRQHVGSVKAGVKGVNGFMFEWYGFFMHLFAHAYYGWGANREPEDFYKYSLDVVFGAELSDDILYVLKNMLTIHESQLKIFQMEFPFARNKVAATDLNLVNGAIADWQNIMKKLLRIKDVIAADEQLKVYLPHFEKLIVANRRNRVIYDLALASIEYDNTSSEEERKNCLKKMYDLNEQDFDIIKANYFDVNPVSETGTKSCMIPYHELKRVIVNNLYPELYDPAPIYLGIEALGWSWL
ncbi:MAG: hypothetical protein ACYCXK_11485 [Candidatus Humimicrobiaceae bacterium]